MNQARKSTSDVYWKSVFIGAYVGIFLQMVVTTWGEPFDSSELWTVPVILLAYGLFAVPFVALGLGIFGLPVTTLLRRSAQAWWVGGVAALWGCLSGKLMFYIIDHLLFFGLYDLMELSFPDLGIVYGLPTGLAWWALHRRELAGR
ncbi:hypothetical protein [Qipengyuania sphaerica]|uniref:hypothetical protein n=1 Tax=Qipengyuania sphaerica TaxID=2867243 RepID=UPI001C8849D5|nr:hypothetical protein [Qipengyuania sphaerica]MBX7541683.1 hypothetical protein [Qipengyuania sphaerica]